MLTELLKEGIGEKEHFNCAEKMLQAANISYNLGLDDETLKLATGFGGGMDIEATCGALTASVMVLGKLFVKDRINEYTKIRILTREFLEDFKREMGTIDCALLKEKYFSKELICGEIINKAAEILDRIVKRESGI